MRAFPFCFLALLLSACSLLYDEATHLAYAVKREVRHLGKEEGSSHFFLYDARAMAGADVRSVKVQFDQAGALVVWHYDVGNTVIGSGGTSYHNRFVATPATQIIDKAIDDPIRIELRRQNGRAVIFRVD